MFIAMNTYSCRRNAVLVSSEKWVPEVLMVNFIVGDSCDKFVGCSAVDRMSIVCHLSLFELTKAYKWLGLKVDS